MNRNRDQTIGHGVLMIVVVLLGIISPAHSKQQRPSAWNGTLVIQANGFAHNNGLALAKLFLRDDDVPGGAAYRMVQENIIDGNAVLVFEDLPYATYALVVVHDENSNGKIDHNLISIPEEPLGFSNGFRISIFSGVPDFNDLRFSFTAKDRLQKITVH